MEIEKVIEIIKSGGVGIFPTDTLYGLVGQASKINTVHRVYELKERPGNKPFIILISQMSELEKFSIGLDKKIKAKLETIWPNQVTVILPASNPKFEYLTRGLGSLAFRLPKDEQLLELLKKTGPLIAPSANLSNAKPAETIEEARKIFGDKVDFYYDLGARSSSPSTIVRLVGDHFQVLREGGVKVV